MDIKIINFYPTEEEKIKKIENEKYTWFLSRIRDKYPEDMISLAVESLIREATETVR